MSLLDLVDPLIGSDSHHGFSTGNCLPLCVVPFGMTAWAPQTAEGPWFFDRRLRKLQGIRATHQPSPWIGDYGHFVICPQTGELSANPSRRASAYRLDRSTVKPHHLRFEFMRYRCTVDMAPTKRCAHFKFQFSQGEAGRILFEPCAGESEFSVDIENGTVCGFTRGNSGGCPAGFACYFYATFSVRIKGGGVISGGSCDACTSSLKGDRVGGYVEFGDEELVEMKLATSFVSVHQAHITLERELGNCSFDETLERAGRVWEEHLSRIEIETTNEADKRLFYTCLYRTQIFPRFWNEEDHEGKVVHFSPYDDKVHEGSLVVDNGFWDTYRTVYPLFALLQPEKLAEMLGGWVSALNEGGWFPQWASPGYRACMVGTHIDAVMADAVSRGVTNFDLEAAFEGLLKHAYHPGDQAGSFGRIGIEDYIALGYVACDHHDSSVARTLDYAYDDWCIAQIATHLGRTEEAERLLKRSQSYRNLWDEESGFMRARNSDGSFLERFDPLLWGDPYVEGGPWQSTWAVQHDVPGLIELMGGNEKFVEKLQQMLTMRPDFNVGTYNFEIHEITEMACADFGQYAHSNQPVHHVLYLYGEAGRRDLMRHWVHRILTELYTLEMLPGDEDNGEMSAWYVLSSLGFFPLTPGKGDWVLGALHFDRAVIHREDGSQLELVRNPNGNPDKVLVDGTTWEKRSIDHGRLATASRIEFGCA